jgi:hypothetical protein
MGTEDVQIMRDKQLIFGRYNFAEPRLGSFGFRRAEQSANLEHKAEQIIAE